MKKYHCENLDNYARIKFVDLRVFSISLQNVNVGYIILILSVFSKKYFTKIK